MSLSNSPTTTGSSFTLDMWADSGSGDKVQKIVLSDAAGTNPLTPLQQTGGSILITGRTAVATPTVTVGAYPAGQPMGGIITLANALPANLFGTLQSIFLRFKATTQAVAWNVTLLDTGTLSGSYADHATPTWNAADDAHVLGCWQLSSAINPLGVHTIYELDGIGKPITGLSTSLFAIVTPVTAPVNPASASEFSIGIGVT